MAKTKTKEIPIIPLRELSPAQLRQQKIELIDLSRRLDCCPTHEAVLTAVELFDAELERRQFPDGDR